ncbi:pimeloyl-ACP methyl ester carboxylesterase [Caulobacter ginsengisoli]|uniref:Pimeloyl-ACP methyl ester carboxylesterase n=1 Tax=Caulobacter ginsengisoli TaxID=400775 RepID=A0ABU0IY71_9CAUL|nr:alpha/beta hydrolase [Caulobacter ginsengisoli]MDQ0466276.1 pimeloyl-ACP methyl ester carboxylesterase [Caulobacter ginsengisoli]
MDADQIPYRRRRIAISGGEIAGIELGPEERPLDILFLHANGFNALTYRSILAPLAKDYRILSVDQRGHGLTSLPADPSAQNSWYGFRDDLIALLDALDAPPLVLGGHSMGGAASLMAAAERPGAVKALALFDPVLMPATVSAEILRDTPLARGALRRRGQFASRQDVVESYRGRGAFKTWSEAMLVDYVQDGFTENTEGVGLTCTPGWEAANFSSPQGNVFSAFGKITVPIHILRAETGSTFNIGERAAGLPGNVRIETIEGTSHFLPMERPDLVRDALTEAASL